MHDNIAGGPSGLLRDWFDAAGDAAGAAPGDHFHAIETDEPRGPEGRRVAVGGVVDGVKNRTPAVLLYALTSDDYAGELAVTSREAAESILAALRLAWPEVGTNATPPEDEPPTAGEIAEWAK